MKAKYYNALRDMFEKMGLGSATIEDLIEFIEGVNPLEKSNKNDTPIEEIRKEFEKKFFIREVDWEDEEGPHSCDDATKQIFNFFLPHLSTKEEK